MRRALGVCLLAAGLLAFFSSAAAAKLVEEEKVSTSQIFSPEEKFPVVKPAVDAATNCFKGILADPRGKKKSANFAKLIVKFTPRCKRQVRDMIDEIDRYYGEGRGEAYFLGAYLDGLPKGLRQAAGKK